MDDENVISPEQEAAPGEAVVGSAPTEEPEQVESVETSEEAPKANEAWAKARVENKQLREELEALKAQVNQEPRPSAFDQIRNPQSPTYQDPQAIAEPNWSQFGVYDPNQAVQTARNEAVAVVEEKLDEERARRDFPEIFANQELEELVAGNWFTKKTRGQQVSIHTEAKRVADLLAKGNKQQVQEAVTKTLSEVTEKESASLDAINQTSGPARVQQSRDTLQGLRDQTRRGNVDAIAMRLKNIE